MSGSRATTSTAGLVSCLIVGALTALGVLGVVGWGGGGKSGAATVSSPYGSTGPSFGSNGSGGPSPSVATAPTTPPVDELKTNFPPPPNALVSGVNTWTTEVDAESVASFYRSTLSARGYRVGYSSLQPDKPDGVYSSIFQVDDAAGNGIGLISILDSGPGTTTQVDWNPF